MDFSSVVIVHAHGSFEDTIGPRNTAYFRSLRFPRDACVNGDRLVREAAAAEGSSMVIERWIHTLDIPEGDAGSIQRFLDYTSWPDNKARFLSASDATM